MAAKRKILFLNHSASRNGASILLLHLLHWLKEHSDFGLEVLSDGSGPLIEQFRTVAATRIWRSPMRALNAVTHRPSILLRRRIDAEFLKLFLNHRRYDLVYANTIATWEHVLALRNDHRPVLWHVHELSYVLRAILGEAQAHEVFPLASRFVAVSQAVGELLTGEFVVPTDRVDLVHGFVPVREVSRAQRCSIRSRILTDLGWPEDAFVVGGCGTPGWRKGTDLFLQIARLIVRDDAKRRACFLWVGGGEATDADVLQFTHEIQTLGLAQWCRRIPSTADVHDYYSAMDIFALTSREDPFPLVMLEAGMQGLPTVCFSSAGGAPEFVADDAGLIVPYLDLEAFAHSVEALRESSELRRHLGERARDKVKTYYGVKTQGPKLLQSIERCLATGCT